MQFIAWFFLGTSMELITQPWTEETRGLCPVCLRDVPATLVEDGGRIWIRQTCGRHGQHRALLASDSAEYLRLRQYVPDRSGASCCCGPGEVCGPGEQSGPPVCVLLLEITQACNLRCPTCYADAQGHDFMTVAEARRRLDVFFQKQSRLDVLMLSGGEPTIHPQFREILDAALAYPVGGSLSTRTACGWAERGFSGDAGGAQRARRALLLVFQFPGVGARTLLRARSAAGKDRRAEKAGAAGLVHDPGAGGGARG